MEKLSKAKDLNGNGFSKKTVSIAGLGSVGSHVAEALARIGISLRVVDMGRIEPYDISMAALYTNEEQTKFKAKEAKKHIEEIMPQAKVKSFHEQLNKENIYLLESDLVIDCTQNWEISKLINTFCKSKKIPVILCRYSGAQGLVVADKGFKANKVESFVEKIGTVKEKGLLPATVFMASSLILSKTLKILSGEKVSNKIYSFDTWKGTKKESQL